MGDALGPLTGRTVLVTRTAEQARDLIEPLEASGARVIACPTIGIVDPLDTEPVRRAVVALDSGDYDWVVFTSTNTVDRFLAAIREHGDVAQTLSHARVAAVGSATQRRLEKQGIHVDVVPADYRAEGLIEEFLARGVDETWRVLIPRAQDAREILPDTLRENGALVDIVFVYRTVAAPLSDECVEALTSSRVDAVTVTSPSTARFLCEALEQRGIDPTVVLEGRAVSIGPVSSDELVRRGISVAVEARTSTTAGMVEAIERLLGS